MSQLPDHPPTTVDPEAHPLSFSSQVREQSSPVLLDQGHGAKTLLVTFAGLSGAVGLQPFEFFNITRPFSVDKIFVRDLSQGWYLGGLTGWSNSVTETAQFLAERIALYPYEKVVFLGNSMGGYAAIAHGVLAGATTILAFVPQTFLDAGNRARCGDRRWSQRMANLPRPDDRRVLDLQVLLDGVAYNSKIKLFYAPEEPNDKAHAEHLAGCNNVDLHPCVGGGHLVVRELKKSGALYRILRAALAEGGEDRLLSVWKEEGGIGIAAALQRHGVRAEEFAAYRAKHLELERAQQGLLQRFFSTIETYIPQQFGHTCVTAAVAPQTLRHSPEFCRRWFTPQKKQFFGSFFTLPDPRFLLHVELGTLNLHIGIVRCQTNLQGGYDILPMQEEEYAEVLGTLATANGEGPPLTRRNWGPRWCSVDCGRFDNPEMYSTCHAMTEFPRSALCKEIVAPFIRQLDLKLRGGSS